MSLSRRDFLARSALATAGLLVGANCAQGQTTAAVRPRNVLLIMTDQQSRAMMSFTGSRYALTPNLDRLARGGVFFDNACCPHPVCTPSRCALHTGIYPWASGIHLNLSQEDEHNPAKGIPVERPIMATPFHEAGFACTHHGKWHASTPSRHPAYAWNAFTSTEYRAGGFDHYPYRNKRMQHRLAGMKTAPAPGEAQYGGWPVYLQPHIADYYHRWTQWAKQEGLPENFVRLGLIGRTSLPLDADPAVGVVDDTLRDLSEFRDRPTFITCSMDPPHEPWIIQEEYYRQIEAAEHALPVNFPHLPEHRPSQPPLSLHQGQMLGPEGVREFIRVQGAMVRMVDDQVGRILRQVEENGALDDTLIVFTSDHGEMLGGHGCVGKSVNQLYDELVRVPLIFHWPRGISGGRRIAQPVSLVDIMPTVLDLAGLTIPAQCQGLSHRGLLQGAREDANAFALCERTHPVNGAVQRLIRTERHALTLTTSTTAGARPRYELYDFLNDPGETCNLAQMAAHAALRDDLIERLRTRLRATNDPWESRVDWKA